MKTPQWFNYLEDEETPLYAAWINNAHFSGQPVLIAICAGSRARHTNRLSDEAAITGCLKTLRLMFGGIVDDRLFFAGEATHPNYFGTVHAAYETGIRAAREVIHRAS